MERFAIGQIKSHRQLQTLTQRIPSMRVQKLNVVMHWDFDDEEYAKGELLYAVKDNFRLRSVKSGIFNQHDTQRLLLYANRNERLDQWVDNPVTVQQKVWPDALTLAEKAGPDFLFRGLRSVLGSDSTCLQGARKHKDPE